MRYKFFWFSFLLIFVLACQGTDNFKIYEIIREEKPIIEITGQPPVVNPTPIPAGGQPDTASQTEPQAPVQQPTPIPIATPTPEEDKTFFEGLSLTPRRESSQLRYIEGSHGIILAFILPFLFCGVPWMLVEAYLAFYLRPRSTDLSEIQIRAQDGLFINTAISMTARRSFTLAVLSMTWPRVRDVVEKAVEQELVQDAQDYRTIDELEKNLTVITNKLGELPVINELNRDFGVVVMRFNIEVRYPQATIDAINRRAEAVAGGRAFQAYAAAAGLNPGSPESRELYKVYQETKGQVDAARNLGGGITSLANMFGKKIVSISDDDNDSDE